jgi:hypothetical protein
MRAFVLFVALLVGLVVGSFVVGMDGPQAKVLPGTEITCPSPVPAGYPAIGGGSPGGATP